jgi:hypothetical protein
MSCSVNCFNRFMRHSNVDSCHVGCDTVLGKWFLTFERNLGSSSSWLLNACKWRQCVYLKCQGTTGTLTHHIPDILNPQKLCCDNLKCHLIFEIIMMTWQRKFLWILMCTCEQTRWLDNTHTWKMCRGTQMCPEGCSGLSNKLMRFENYYTC